MLLKCLTAGQYVKLTTHRIGGGGLRTCWGPSIYGAHSGNNHESRPHFIPLADHDAHNQGQRYQDGGSDGDRDGDPVKNCASLCGQSGVHVKPYRRVSTLGAVPRMQALGQVTCVGTCSSHHHG